MNSSIKNIDDIQSSDGLDKLIFEKGLRIKKVWNDQDLDLIILLFNNKMILKRPLADFPALHNSNIVQLNNFETDGIGIHWPDLDEDLSPKGFLIYELENIDIPILV